MAIGLCKKQNKLASKLYKIRARFKIVIYIYLDNKNENLNLINFTKGIKLFGKQG